MLPICKCDEFVTLANLCDQFTAACTVSRDACVGDRRGIEGRHNFIESTCK